MTKSKKAKIRNTSVILGLILAIFLVANRNSLTEDKKLSKSRVPASRLLEEPRSGSIEIEKRYAVALASVEKKRKLASIGRPASAIENFRFGILEGKYALTMDGDKIREVAFIDTPESDGRPTTLGSRSEFFSKFGALFGMVSEPQKISIDVSGNRIVETYRARTATSGASDVLIKLTLDDSDRLITLQSEKISSLKIF